MDRCYFARECPRVEIKAGLVFIRPEGARCEIAMSPATLREFVVHANAVLGDWRIEESGKVERLDHWRAHAASP